MPKIIDVPEPINITWQSPDPFEAKVDREMNFYDFLLDCLGRHSPLGKGFDNIEKGFNIKAAINAAKEENEKKETDKVIRIERDTDFDAVKAAVEGRQWAPFAAAQMLTFYKAVRNAQDVEKVGKKE